MSRRALVLIAVAAVMTAGAGLLRLSRLSVAVQAQTRASTTAAAKAGAASKTSWGEPDLQGIWSDNYEIPLERPVRYANREVFTAAEIADLDKRRASAAIREAVAPKGSEQDVGGAYNTVYISVKPTGRRTSLIVDPPDGRLPALTPNVKKRRDDIVKFELALMQATNTCKNKLAGCAGGTYGPPSPRRAETPPYYVTSSSLLDASASGAINRSDGPEDRTLGERCMSGGLPDFGGFRRIVQAPGAVSIFYDTQQGQGWQRIIPVTGTPHLPADIRQWWGDSRARWDGNSLVVDVTNFTPKKDYLGSREHLHLVERWTRLDADTLEYIVTVEDPTTWTRAWTARQELTKQQDQPNRIYYEPRCHEGNYGMAALLAGARADERAFAEGRGPDPATKCIGGCGSGVLDRDQNRDQTQ